MMGGMSDPAALTLAAFAGDRDVRDALGRLGDRLPADLDIPRRIAVAHADVVDRLVQTYGTDLPTWGPVALDLLRWTEAKLAAALILEQLTAAANVDPVLAVSLREAAHATLARGLPGHAPGQPDTVTPRPPDGPALPTVSTAAPGSNFADPYAPAYVTRVGPVDAFYVL